MLNNLHIFDLGVSLISTYLCSRRTFDLEILIVLLECEGVLSNRLNAHGNVWSVVLENQRYTEIKETPRSKKHRDQRYAEIKGTLGYAEIKDTECSFKSQWVVSES